MLPYDDRPPEEYPLPNLLLPDDEPNGEPDDEPNPEPEDEPNSEPEDEPNGEPEDEPRPDDELPPNGEVPPEVEPRPVDDVPYVEPPLEVVLVVPKMLLTTDSTFTACAFLSL